MREPTSLYNHIYSAESTMKYFLLLKSECIFVPISVELAQTGKPALDLFVIGVLCLESVEHLLAEICDNPVELISSLNISHLLVY